MAWAPDYTTSARLKSYLRIDTGDDDAFVSVWISAASRNVDDHCKRQFGRLDVAESREYRGRYDRDCGRYVFHVDDVPALTGALAVVDDNGNAVTGYRWEPANAVARGKPYTRLVADVAGPIHLTERFGWLAPPPSIEQGLWLFAARLAARRDSPFGIAGSPSEGSELRLLAKLDPDMITVLKPYRRMWGAS